MTGPSSVTYRPTQGLLLQLFCFYVVIWFLQIGERIELLEKVRLELIVASVLLAVSAAVAFSSLNTGEKPSGMAAPVTFFILAVIFSILFSRDSEISWNIFYSRLLKFSCMAIFILSFVRSPGNLRMFFFWFMVGCLYITQESFRAALDGSMVWENQGVPRLHGDTSLFRHPNSLGGLATGAFPFVWYLFSTTRSKLFKLLLLATVGTAFGCVLYSGSRTSYLGFLFFILFILFHSKKKLLYLVSVTLMISFFYPALPKAYQMRFMTIFTGRDIEGASMSTRRKILSDAWIVTKTNPFGVGVGAFPLVRQQMFGRMQDTHNLYLEVATNLGIQGLLAFIILVYKILSVLSGVRRSLEDQIKRLKDRFGDSPAPPLKAHLEDLNFMTGACMATSGYIWIRLVLGFFGMDLYEIYWWMGLGLAAALYRINQTSSQITEEWTRKAAA